MAVTVAPSVEAMRAITDRINTGGKYCLEVLATYGEQMIDPLEEITGLRVDVVSETEEQLNETLDLEDNTSHVIRIWIRKKLDNVSNEVVDEMKLLVRQIFQRVNQWRNESGRVQIWEADFDSRRNPDKAVLHQQWLFVSQILLRVEVGPS